MPKPERGTILIVDDIPANLAFLSDALDHVGYKTLVATNGYNAINQLRLVTPDLILLDVLMPGLDGFETCRRLKSDDRTRDIPIVFMTALDGTEDIVRAFGLGAADYVTKPVNHEEVLARIATRLRCSRAVQQYQEAMEVSGAACVVIDCNACVTLIAPRAKQLVRDYLGVDLSEGMPLPEPLRDGAPAPAGGASSSASIHRQGRRLRVRSATGTGDGRTMLVLEEELVREPPVAELAATFGLTRRETEVILWVAKGKTNRDIGLILNMSPRTVNKHLEHVYIKLGVETRTAAANKVAAAIY